MQRRNVKYALLIITTAAVGYLCFLMFVPFLVAIAWAAVFAIILNPVYQTFLRRFRSPNAAAAIALIFTLVVIAAPLIGLGTMVTRSVINLLDAQGVGRGPVGYQLRRLDLEGARPDLGVGGYPPRPR